MAKVRAHLLVSGVVQGVYFRLNMKRVAEMHGVTGWVRNLPDGRTVEAVLEGEREDVDKVICWSMHGPPMAVVTGVRVEFTGYKGEFTGFSIRY